MPSEVRADVRQELSLHLSALIASHHEREGNVEAATHAALMQFGRPQEIARHFRRAWATTGGTAAASASAARWSGLTLVSYIAILYPLLWIVTVGGNAQPLPQVLGLSLWERGASLLLIVAPFMLSGGLSFLAGIHAGRQLPHRRGLGVLCGLTIVAVLLMSGQMPLSHGLLVAVLCGSACSFCLYALVAREKKEKTMTFRTQPVPKSPLLAMGPLKLALAVCLAVVTLFWIGGGQKLWRQRQEQAALRQKLMEGNAQTKWFSQSDYGRLIDLRENVYRTRSLSDADLRWCLSLLPFGAVSGGRGIQVTNILYDCVSVMTPAQKERTFQAMAGKLQEAGPRGEIGEQRTGPMSILRELRDRRAIPLLQSFRNDPNPRVRTAAEATLGQSVTWK